MDESPVDALYRLHRIPRRSNRPYFDYAFALARWSWSQFDVVVTTGADAFMPTRRNFGWIRIFHGSSFDEAIHTRSGRFRRKMIVAGVLDTATMLRADLCVHVSSNSRRWHPRAHFIIPNGVDPDVFFPGAKSPFPSILFVGSLGGRKRGALLRDVFADQVRSVIPEAELWLVLAEADVVPRRGERIFHNRPETEIASLYRRAWLYCSMATYEGFGIPYIESLASGTPVISSRNAGVTEISQRGGSVAIFEEDDALGSAVCETIQNYDSTSIAERAQRESIYFGWPRVVEQFEAAFAEVLARR